MKPHSLPLAVAAAFTAFGLSTSAHAATGFFGDGTGAAIFYVTDGSTSGEGTYRNVSNLNNFDYGDFIVLNGGSTTLMLRGGEGKTYKNSGGDVYGVNEYYRIYVDGATPGSYSSFGLPFNADLGGGDQRWKKTDQNVNLLSGLTQSGRYVVEYYWEQTGNQGTQYMNNSGANYKTYFDLNYEINTSGTVTQNTAGGAATLSGNGTFVNKGSGTVQINANNSAYTGLAYVDQGTIEFQEGAFLTSGSITLGAELSASTGTLTISDSNGGTNVSNIIVVRANGAGSTIGATNTSGTNSYSGSIYLDGNATTSISSGGTLSFNGTEIDLKNQNLTVTGAGNTAISGTVRNSTGTGKIIKQGTGTLTLSGANSLSGNTEIDEGTILVTGSMGSSAIYIGNGGGSFNNANSALTFNGSTASYSNNIQVNTSGGTGTRTLTKEGTTAQTLAGTLAVNNALALNVNGTGGLTISGATSGAGNISIGGTGILTLTNNNSYTGSTSINAGATLQLGSGSTSGWVGSTSGISNNGTLVYNRSNNVSTALIISGSGALTKNGSGTLTLSGANSYSGATTINAGTLASGLNDVIGDSSVVTVAGGTLNVGTRTEALHSLFLNSGSVLIQGAGNLTLNNASSITGGEIRLSADNGRINTTGTLTLGSSSYNYTSSSSNNGANALALGGDIAVNSSTTFNFLDSGGGSGDPQINLTNQNRTFDVGSGANLNVDWIIRSTSNSLGLLTKNGSGTLTLNKTNTYSGGTTINNGTLVLGHATDTLTGAVTINGGTLSLGSNSDTVGAVTLAGGNITGTGGVLTGTGTYALQSGTVSAILGGSISANKTTAGTVTLSGANTFSGGLRLSAGQINLNNAAAAGSGTFTIAGGSIDATTAGITLNNNVQSWNSDFTFVGTNSLNLGTGAVTMNATRIIDVTANTLTVGGAIGQSSTGFGITKNGAGTLALSGANTYNGTTTINAGTLSLGASNVLADTSSVSLTGGELAIGSNSDTISGFTMSGGTFAGSGTLTATTYALQGGAVNANLGTGTATVTSGTTTLSGTLGATTVNINSGNLTLAAANRLADTAAVTVNASLNLGGFNDTIGALSGNSSGTIALGAGTLTTDSSSNTSFAGGISGSGGLTKAGSGALTLTGANSFSGTTTINSGSIRLGGAASSDTLSGNIVVNTGGTLDYSSSNDNQIKDTAFVTVAGGTFDAGARGETIAGLTITSGTFTKAGGTFSLGGNLTMSGGNLSITSSGTLALGAASSITSGTVSLSNAAARINTTGTTTLGTSTFSYNNASAATQGIVLAGDFLVNNSSTVDFTNAAAGAGRISLGGAARVFDVGSSANMNVGWVIDATNTSGTLTKNGTGTLTLTAANTYSGTTTLNNGRININNNAALGTGAFTINGGSIDSTTAGITLNNNVQSWNSDFTFVGTNSLNLGTGAVAMNATRTVTVTANNLTVGGVISGSTFGLTKTGSGTLTLSGNNTFTGQLTIAEGVVIVSSFNNAGASGVLGNSTNSVVLGSTGKSGTLSFGGSTVSSNKTFTMSDGGTGVFDITTNQLTVGAINGLGALSKTGSGTLVLGSTSTYSGGSSLLAGTVAIGVNAALGNGTINLAGSALRATTGGNRTLSNSIIISADTTFATLASEKSLTFTGNTTLSGGTRTLNVLLGDYVSTEKVTFSGAIGDGGNGFGMTKTGNGTLTLSGANTYTGTTTVSAGTLEIGNINALQNTTLDTGASGTQTVNFTVAGANTYNLGGLQGSDALAIGNNTLSIGANNASTTFSGSISGTGGNLTKVGSGTLTLTGVNTYNGTTTINNGSLNANHANSLGNTANVTVNGGSLLVSADGAINSKAIRLASTASGNGSAASLVFSGTYNGTAGSLTLNQNSIIDLGEGSVVVHFADLFMSTYTLSIYNWTGTTLWGGGDGNNTDQFYIDRTLTGSELNNISFYSGIDNSSFVGTAYQLSGGSFNNQVIPVPEPESLVMAAILLMGSVFVYFRRRQKGLA